jgi:four helix bundle protein
MRDPERLEVVERAAELAQLTYEVTRDFPRDERFGLTAQMRRASVSVGSNIVEGCGRKSNAAFVSFVHIALGSALELAFQARLAGRLGFGNAAELEQLQQLTERLIRMIRRLQAAVSRP